MQRGTEYKEIKLLSRIKEDTKSIATIIDNWSNQQSGTYQVLLSCIQDLQKYTVQLEYYAKILSEYTY